MTKNTSEQLYRFKTFNGDLFSFTAQELYAEFMKEADSEFLISTSEVLNVCNKKDFPKDYAKKIKLCFFKSFKNSKASIFDIPFKERSVLFSCYNTLSNTNEIEFNEKREFLIKFLDNVTAKFILQESISNSANSIKVCEIYNSWKQSLIEDLLNKNKVKFTCLNQKNLFKSFKKALVAEIGKKGFLEYIEENKSQQGDFLQYTRFATNI